MRRGLAGALTLALSICLFSPARAADPQAVLQRADEAFATGGIAGMVDVFREAIQASASDGRPDPALLPVYSLYADATRATGDNAGALSIAEAGLAIARSAEAPDKEIVAALAASRAYALIAVGPEAAAIEALREAVALSDAAYGSVPSEAYLRIDLAGRLDMAGQFAEAAKVRQAVVAMLATGGDEEQSAAATLALARSLFLAGEIAASIEAYRSALAAVERLAPADGLRRATVMNGLAVVLLAAEDAAEAGRLLDSASDLVEDAGAEADLVAAIATNRATALSRTGRFVEGREAAERAVALWRDIGEDAVLAQARALNVLVEIELALGRFEAAFAASGRALALTRGHEADASGVAAEALDARGTVLFALQRFREAAEVQRHALTSWQALRSDDSVKAIVARQNLAGTLVELGAYDEARELLGRALESAERTLDGESAVRATVLSTQGSLLLRLGDFREGGEAFERAVAVWRQRAPDSVLEARELANLAAARIGIGRSGEAEAILHRALSIWQASAPGHPDADFAFLSLIELLERQGRSGEALALAERLDALGEASGGLRAAHAKLALSMLLRAAGRAEEAEAPLRAALSLRREALGDRHPAVAEALGQLCLVLSDLGNLRDATACAEDVLVLRRETLPKGHREIGVALNNAAFVDGQAGRIAAASLKYGEALAIADAVYGPVHPAVSIVAANLGVHILEREGRPAGSLPYLRRAAASVADAAFSEATRSVGTSELLRRGRGVFVAEVRALWMAGAMLRPEAPGR